MLVSTTLICLGWLGCDDRRRLEYKRYQRSLEALHSEGQAFCESLVPRLEEYKKDTGAYPAQIELILRNVDELPAILLEDYNRDSWYWTNGGEFMLSFRVHADFNSSVVAYYYQSKNGVWETSFG